MIRLRLLFRIDMPDALVMHLTALPTARAAAYISHRDLSKSLMLIERGAAEMRPIDDARVPGAGASERLR